MPSSNDFTMNTMVNLVLQICGSSSFSGRFGLVFKLQTHLNNLYGVISMNVVHLCCCIMHMHCEFVTIDCQHLKETMAQNAKEGKME